jgi:hypothetical protein
MSSRCMSLLPRTTLHSDSEQCLLCQLIRLCMCPACLYTCQSCLCAIPGWLCNSPVCLFAMSCLPRVLCPLCPFTVSCLPVSCVLFAYFLCPVCLFPVFCLPMNLPSGTVPCIYPVRLITYLVRLNYLSGPRVFLFCLTVQVPVKLHPGPVLPANPSRPSHCPPPPSHPLITGLISVYLLPLMRENQEVGDSIMGC